MAFFSFPISHLIDRWSRRKAIGVLAGVLFLMAAQTYPEDSQKVKDEAILAE